jgi:hypothetical protein
MDGPWPSGVSKRSGKPQRTRRITKEIVVWFCVEQAVVFGWELIPQGSLSIAQSLLPAFTTTSAEVRGRVHREPAFAGLGKSDTGNW